MNKKSFPFLLGGVTFLLMAIFGFQLHWIKQTIEFSRADIEKNIRSELMEAKQALESNYHCFRLSTDVLLEPGETLLLQNVLSQREKIALEGGELNRTYKINYPDTSWVYPLQQLSYGVPIEFQVTLRGKFNDHTIPYEDRPEWLRQGYAHTLFKEGSHELVIDTVILKSTMRQLLKNTGIQQPFGYKLVDPAENKTYFEQGLANASTADVFTAPLYDDASLFPTEYRLSVYFDGLNSQVLNSHLPLILSSVVVALLLVVLFFFLVRLLRAQYKVNQIREDLIGNMTHELQTPVSNIQLSLQTLKRKLVPYSTDGDYGSYLSIMENETANLSKKIEYVLNAAVIKNKGNKIEMSKIDLRVVVEDACASVQKQHGQRNAKIKLSIDDDARQIYGDAYHLQNVVLNLLENAVKYNENKPEIEIIAKRYDRLTRLIVKDNGIGLNTDEKEQVFDRFFRAHNGLDHNYKGFGIGLSYSKEVIESLDGKISVKSRPGRGSEFIIELKAA